MCAQCLRSAHTCITTPEENRQHDHEEGVRSQVRGEGKVRIERGSASSFLQQSQIGGLPSHERDERLTERMAPGRQFGGIWRQRISFGTIQRPSATF